MDADYYKYQFSRLHTARYKGKAAPHKAVLLIAVMRLVERGAISSTEIELTDELVETFKAVWAEKVPATCSFSCSIGQPFYHMQHEPFWRLLVHDEEYNMVAEELGLFSNQMKDMPNGYTVSAIRRKFRCAIIEQQLFDVMKVPNSRALLEKILVDRYLSFEPPLSTAKMLVMAITTSLVLVA